MQALSIAFEAIVPLFLIIAVGYGVKRLGWIGLEEVRRFNKVTFYTFMPVMLFYNIYISDFSQAVRLPYVLFVVGMALGMAVVAFGVVLPGGNLGVTALMIAIVVPFYNMMSVVVLEYFRGGKPKLGEVLLAVAKNPLIIGSILGLLMQGLHIALPEVLVSFAGKMNSAATPLILLLLGASFEAQELATYKKELLVCVGLRLVVFPGLILTLSMALGLRDIEFVTLLAMTAAPTAVNSFNMAQQLGGDSHLAGSAVVVSTALSFFTLFFWITLFKQLSMF